jgi:hypothetical protein
LQFSNLGTEITFFFRRLFLSFFSSSKCPVFPSVDEQLIIIETAVQPGTGRELVSKFVPSPHRLLNPEVSWPGRYHLIYL